MGEGWVCDRKKKRRPFPHYTFVVAASVPLRSALPGCGSHYHLPPSGLFSILENRPDFLREKTTLPGKKNTGKTKGRRRATAPGATAPPKKQNKTQKQDRVGPLH